MKHLLTAFLLLVVLSAANSQTVKSLEQLLQAKSVAVLDSYITQVSTHYHVRADWKYRRDVTDNYQEGKLQIERMEPDRKQEGVFIVYTYEVKMLTKQNEIAYYQLSEIKNKKVKGEWVPYNEVNDEFRNDTLIKAMKASFKNNFAAELNEEELFVDTVVYGRACGYGGVDPYEKEQIDQWVKSNDQHSLLKWLQSTNLERQVYAVDGFYQLHAMVAISPTTLEMIKHVLNKNGTLQTCAGCMFMTRNIKETVWEFKF